ncbi:MAG: biosynthetic-type acetolactate synthase large subunit [Chloroflexi bacterium]|nr:biosynthetic-type acetolactate synthase large subunit [Chloroflexota bacterium]
MKRTGAQIVWEMLEREGVEVVFGIPGGAIMHTYHPREEYDVRHILVRHEQCAAHAADGYARASGKVGVAMSTSGPGATNLVTGIATAMMDSSPMVCITGQVASSLIGSDAFQEIDITGITLPITKHNYVVTDVNDLAYIIHEAFYIARSGRPGPVLIDLPKDVQKAETDFVPPEKGVRLPGYRPVVKYGDPKAVRQAAEMINSAQRPVILAGQGVLMSGAMDVLRTFVEETETPVAITLLGKGGFPESHPLSLGLMGMHGEAHVNQAIQEADLLLAFGMRFDDRVTGTLETFAPQAHKVHVDMDPAELNKVVPVDVPILGDLRHVLEQLLPLTDPTTHPSWLEQIGRWRRESQLRDIVYQSENGHLVAPHFINAIWEATRGEAIMVTDVGQHQMWAAQYYHHDQPNPLITSGGQGTMGFGLPAAIGAQIAQPDKEVWAIVGDGGFQMTIHDLATVVQEQLPLRIALSNNGCLGMVRQWQEMFYDQRYEATQLQNPDFVKLVEAYGIRSWQATNKNEACQAIAEARSHSGPAFIEFQIVQEGQDANVYPMVPAGAALHEMIRRPALTVKAW